MKITLFASATDSNGTQFETTWPEFIEAIRQGLNETAADKRQLPAFGPYALSGPRSNANVKSFSALAFDLDHDVDPDALGARLEAQGCAALAYETPGSTPAAPRLRLVLPLDGEMPPEQYAAARASVATALALEPDPVTHDPSRISFVGGYEGAPPRELYILDGEATPATGWAVAASVAAPDTSAAGEWPTERRAPDELVAALVEALTPAWHRGERETWFLPFCGWARGKLWTRGDVDAVVSTLPESDAGTHPNEYFAAKLDRVALLPGPGIAREALGYDFDAVDRAIGAHPSAAPFAAEPPVPPPPTATGIVYGPPLIVQRDDRYWLLKPDQATYFPAMKEKDLRLNIERVIGSAFPYRNKHDALISTQDFMAAPGVGEVAYEIVTDFTAIGNKWDQSTRTMRLGYDLTPVVAARDSTVEGWLRALFGADGLDEAYQWIAACRQDRLTELAVALAVVGSPGCGKTVFFRGLARLWGTDFVELGHVVDRFNSVITRCPFWVDDECKTLRKGDMTSEEFRQLIQRSVHDYEPKGLERRQLRGYARFGLTANEPGDLRFGEVYGASAVQAVADRLAVHGVADDAAARRALDGLRLPGTDRIELDRLAAHFAWVMDSVSIRVTRFLGARKDSSAGVTAALQGTVAMHAEVFEYLTEYLAAPDEARRAVRLADGKLFVNPKRLMESLTAINPRTKIDLGRVQRALKPFRKGAPRAERIGSEVVKVWELDLEMLRKALSED